MKNNKRKDLELLNYEGPVLKLFSEVPGEYAVFDQWDCIVEICSRDRLIEFLEGRVDFTDSNGKVWNFPSCHIEARTPLADVLRYMDEVEKQDNYTRPNDEDHVDTPEDWLFGARVFAAALGSILRNGEGVVVELNDDMIHPTDPDARKCLVYLLNGMIHIEPTDKPDMEDGDFLNVLDLNDN